MPGRCNKVLERHATDCGSKSVGDFTKQEHRNYVSLRPHRPAHLAQSRTAAPPAQTMLTMWPCSTMPLPHSHP